MSAALSPGDTRTFDIDIDAADELLRWKQQLQAEAESDAAFDDGSVQQEYARRLRQQRYGGDEQNVRAVGDFFA